VHLVEEYRLLLYHLTLWGYIDPGSGSLVIQFAIALFVSAGFLLRRFVGGSLLWTGRKIKGLFGKSANEPQAGT
jgi:hypothetical protein